MAVIERLRDSATDTKERLEREEAWNTLNGPEISTGQCAEPFHLPPIAPIVRFNGQDTLDKLEITTHHYLEHKKEKLDAKFKNVGSSLVCSRQPTTANLS